MDRTIVVVLAAEVHLVVGKMQILKFFIILWFSLAASFGFAAPSFPALTGRVVDQVGLLSAEKKQNIIAELEAFEVKSTMQVVVAIVASLEGYDIRQYGLELGRHWAIGQKDINNGVLLLVAPNERKVSIEVGYGLEGALPDALAFAIIQDYILPQFKAGKMGEGVELGAQMIVKSLDGEIDVQSLQAAKQQTQSQSKQTQKNIGMIFMLAFMAFVIGAVISAIRNPGGGTGGTSGTTTRRSSSGWSSGGGGYSGGGGSFGGGGASGGW